MAQPTPRSTTNTSPLLVALAWVIVSVPLVWGIYNTSLNAAKLFTKTTAAASPSAAR